MLTGFLTASPEFLLPKLGECAPVALLVEHMHYPYRNGLGLIPACALCCMSSPFFPPFPIFSCLYQVKAKKALKNVNTASHWARAVKNATRVLISADMQSQSHRKHKMLEICYKGSFMGTYCYNYIGTIRTYFLL